MLWLREPYAAPVVRNVPVSTSIVVQTGAGGTSALTRVNGIMTAGGAILFYGAAAFALGVVSYALFSGQWIVTQKHPIWGSIAGLFAIGTLASAGDRMSAKA